ncbi:unnamed protein product [Rhizopus stolonifer]
MNSITKTITTQLCQTNRYHRFYSSSVHSTRRLRTRASVKPEHKINTPYFDAERFARLLEKEGFSPAQANTVIHALDDVVEESTVNVTSDLVSKADQEQTISRYKRDLSKLKSEIQVMEKET